MNNQTLLLIDGNSILNRAYFALPAMNDDSGKNVNAVYGFVNILVKVLADFNPDKLVVTFDLRGQNFRKEIYSEYKANRKGMPDDLAAQMPVLHDLLQSMHVAVVEKPGVEADDIIGTISRGFDGHSLIASGDRDMLQLVSEKTTVLLTKRGVTEVETVDPETLKTSYGLTPAQVIEFKALRGDTSDNIPGVKGIGEKTAMSLLAKYGDIDTLYANIDQERGSVQAKLVEGKEMAYVSKTLATIVTNADVDYDEEQFGLPVYGEEARKMLERLKFRSLLSRLSFEAEEQQTEARQVESVAVADEAQLRSVMEEMSSAPYFAFCYENNEICLSASKNKQYVIKISDSFLDVFTESFLLETLKPLLCDNLPKAVYDGKALKHMLEQFGVELNNVRYDVCLMQYLVEYRAHKNLDSLAQAYGYAEHGAAVFALAEILENQLKETSTDKLYYDVELPLSQLLYEMECEGVKVDSAALDAMSAELHAQLDGLTEEIYELAGEAFNVASPRQLSRILFERLGLKHGKKTSTGYSTNNDVLEKLVGQHPIIEKIMDYRKVSKLLGTYVDGLKPCIRRGLVHTTYNQALTSTGRLSSSDPNLQNIPVRNELGKEVRKVFQSKHGVFVGADYSQIELRLLAAFSEDENLLAAFRNGEDIHTKVAAELLGIPAEMVNPNMRRMAKAVNFGIIYGISDFGLSQNTNISVKKAHEYIDLYFKRFPKIKDYLDGQVEFARRNGYVTTITGRRRQIPEIKSNNYNLKSFGERAAMNMPLQGSAADIMKIAMLKVDKALKAEGLKSKIVLQIHDEIIVDCFVEEAARVKEIIKSEMENAVSLACPLTAETEEGRTLYEA